MLKNSPREELISAVRRALSGDSPLDQGLAAKLLRRMAHESQERKKRSADEPLPPQEVHAARRRPQEPLTPRELEVLKLVATGKTNRQIAEELFLSANTIKVHVQHLIAKLGVSDRTQAATLAVQMGLLSSET
ncbi:MAG: response regulator transcription factor [Actinomycetota bacterium]|nr:response regulator transcription factor [Actinomycetota bacterium]